MQWVPLASTGLIRNPRHRGIKKFPWTLSHSPNKSPAEPLPCQTHDCTRAAEQQDSPAVALGCPACREKQLERTQTKADTGGCGGGRPANFLSRAGE